MLPEAVNVTGQGSSTGGDSDRLTMMQRVQAQSVWPKGILDLNQDPRQRQAGLFYEALDPWRAVGPLMTTAHKIAEYGHPSSGVY